MAWLLNWFLTVHWSLAMIEELDSGDLLQKLIENRHRSRNTSQHP